MNDVVKWNLDTQLQETRSQTRCTCVCVAIFCLTIIVVVGLAGGTAFYFLHIAPTNSAKNETNVHDQHLDNRAGANTGRKNAHVPGCPLSMWHLQVNARKVGNAGKGRNVLPSRRNSRTWMPWHHWLQNGTSCSQSWKILSAMGRKTRFAAKLVGLMNFQFHAIFQHPLTVHSSYLWVVVVVVTKLYRKLLYTSSHPEIHPIQLQNMKTYIIRLRHNISPKQMKVLQNVTSRSTWIQRTILWHSGIGVGQMLTKDVILCEQPHIIFNLFRTIYS